MVKPKRRKVKPLNWNYCECGCKSFDLTVGGRHFSYYNDLQGGYLFAERHHARIFGEPIKFSDIDKRVRKILNQDLRALRKATR